MSREKRRKWAIHLSPKEDSFLALNFMTEKVEIIMAHGALGGSDDDSPLEKLLREFAILHAQNGEWAEKYGTDYEDDIVMMHQYCWCEEETCEWCSGDEPNFRYKPTGFEVTWYKYIGRDMKTNISISPKEFQKMREHILGEKS